MSLVTRHLNPLLVEQLNHLQLSARRVVEGSVIGQHRSPVKGASVEFRQHRFYTVGDEPRRLDWRVLARTDRPYIKEYDEETNLRCVLLLDASGSMAYGGFGESSSSERKFDYAAQLAAALAYLMIAQTEAVGVGVVGEKLKHWLAPKAGSTQLPRVMSALDRATPRGPSDLGLCLRQTADRLGRRSLVVAVTDAFASIARIRLGLARLRHDRHEAIVLQVLHRDELEFPFENWMRFRGLEGEKALLCEPAMTRRTYLDNFRRHQQALTDACRASGTELHRFRTDKPLINSIASFLNRRAR